MSCTTAKYDLCINQFATYKTSLTFRDADSNYLNIASWSFTASIREDVDSSPITNFNIDITSLTSASIELRLDPSQTSGLSSSKYVYDIIATNLSTSPTEIYRLMEGKISVDRGVTIAINP